MPPEGPAEGGEHVELVELVEPIDPVEREPAREPDALQERPSGLRMYRPTPAGLEPNPVELRSWRSGLRSRRWNPAPLANPELSETSTGVAIAFWLVLAGLTFVVLLIGYGIGFWG